LQIEQGITMTPKTAQLPSILISAGDNLTIDNQFA
jgi:hypothetical protein